MDIDQDGIKDIVSGCYWLSGGAGGSIQWMKGTKNGEFEKAVALKTSSGKALMLDVPKEDPGKLYKYANLATQPFLADLNSDGVLDVVVGGFNGVVFQMNGVKGKDGKLLFEDKAELIKDSNGEILKVGNKSSPNLVDWDKDGDLDLVIGSSSGNIYLSENKGSKSKAEWASPTVLIAATKGLSMREENTEAHRVGAARVRVIDFNNDGLLDIVATDSLTITGNKQGMTPEVIADRQQISKQYADFAKQMAENKSISAEQVKSLSETLLKRAKFYKSGHRFESNRGHVWVYLQKPNKPEVSE